MAFAGQRTSAENAGATALAHHSHWRRHDLRPKHRRKLLRFGKLQPKISQTGILIALDARQLGLHHRTSPHFSRQLHAPN
jgi:hypothetical protein